MRFLGFFLAVLLCACSAGPGYGDDAQPQDDGGTLDDATQGNDATQSNDGSQQTDSSTSNILTSPNVQIIVEPNGNGGSEVVNAINAATKSVHMTMYLLSSTDVITALIARHKAGVDV